MQSTVLSKNHRSLESQQQQSLGHSFLFISPSILADPKGRRQALMWVLSKSSNCMANLTFQTMLLQSNPPCNQWQTDGFHLYWVNSLTYSHQCDWWRWEQHPKPEISILSKCLNLKKNIRNHILVFLKLSYWEKDSCKDETLKFLAFAQYILSLTGRMGCFLEEELMKPTQPYWFNLLS